MAVQIDDELFFQLFRYTHMREFMGQEEFEELHKQVCKGIEEKLDRMVMRNLYGQSKTAATPEEREKARQEYLNKRGIPADFRW